MTRYFDTTTPTYNTGQAAALIQQASTNPFATMGNALTDYATTQMELERQRIADQRALTQENRTQILFDRAITEEDTTKKIFEGAAKGPQARSAWMTNAYASPEGQASLDAISLEGIKDPIEYAKRWKAQEDLGKKLDALSMSQKESQPEMYNRLMAQHGSSLKGIEAVITAQAAEQAKEDTLREQYQKQADAARDDVMKYRVEAVDKGSTLNNSRSNSLIVGEDGVVQLTNGGSSRQPKASNFDIKKSSEFYNALMSGQDKSYGLSFFGTNTTKEMKAVLDNAAKAGILTPDVFDQALTFYPNKIKDTKDGLTANQFTPEETIDFGKTLARVATEANKVNQGSTRPLDMSSVNVRNELAQVSAIQKAKAEDQLAKLAMGYDERMNMQAHEKLAPLFAEYSPKALETVVQPTTQVQTAETTKSNAKQAETVVQPTTQVQTAEKAGTFDAAKASETVDNNKAFYDVSNGPPELSEYVKNAKTKEEEALATIAFYKDTAEYKKLTKTGFLTDDKDDWGITKFAKELGRDAFIPGHFAARQKEAEKNGVDFMDMPVVERLGQAASLIPVGKLVGGAGKVAVGATKFLSDLLSKGTSVGDTERQAILQSFLDRTKGNTQVPTNFSSSPLVRSTDVPLADAASVAAATARRAETVAGYSAGKMGVGDTERQAILQSFLDRTKGNTQVPTNLDSSPFIRSTDVPFADAASVAAATARRAETVAGYSAAPLKRVPTQQEIIDALAQRRSEAELFKPRSKDGIRLKTEMQELEKMLKKYDY